MPASPSRKVAVAAALSTLAIALVLGAVVLLMRLLVPGTPPHQDFVQEFNQASRRAAGLADADPNDWPLYEGLMIALMAADQAIGGRPIAEPGGNQRWSIDPTFPPSDDEQVARLSGALSRLDAAGLFNSADRLVTARAARTASGPLLEIPTPDLAPARQFSRLLNARIALAWRDGDDDGAVRALRQSLALVRILAGQPRLIDRMTGLAILSAACDVLRVQAATRPPSPALARRLIEQLSALPHPLFAPVIEGERLTAADAIQRALPGSAPLAAASGSAQRAKVDELLIPLRDAIDTPAARDTAIADYNTAADGLSHSYSVAQMLLFAPQGLVTSDDQALTRFRGTIVLIALEALAAERAAYPDALDALTPDYLAALPMDPYTGRPFAYRLTPGDGSLGYILYSAGADQKDDGGHFDPAVPGRALVTSGQGLDFPLHTVPNP